MVMDYDELIRKCQEYEAGSKEFYELVVRNGESSLVESAKRSSSGWDEIIKKAEEYRDSA